MGFLKYFSLIFILFIFSCNNPFAPALAGKDTPISRLLTPQRTPEEVLSNFRYAYTYKDSLVYSEVWIALLSSTAPTMTNIHPCP